MNTFEVFPENYNSQETLDAIEQGKCIKFNPGEYELNITIISTNNNLLPADPKKADKTDLKMG